MTIDTSGKWWRGDDFSDLSKYLTLLTEESYPAQQVIQSKCSCGGTTFRLRADRDEGCAQRTCVTCGENFLIADSAEYWSDAEPRKVRCACKRDIFEVGLAFSLREDGEVQWITVGHRCIQCGTLASYVDWEVDYAPSRHLLSMA